MRTPASLLGLLAFFALSSAAAAEAPPVDSTRIDEVFAQFRSGSSPGCALAVVKDGEPVYTKGYGMANLDHDVPITPSSVFHVASVSKQFTAAAVALLAQEGKLSLDDPVQKYIPEISEFGSPVTLRHLVHHTSGLRDQWDLLELAGWRYSLDLITNDDVMEVVSRQRELNFSPGEKYLYCNTGYTLLGIVVARVTGRSLREFTTERFFEPLGMKNTHFRDDHAEVIKNQAYGYEPDAKSPAGFRLSPTNFDTVGATSLLTTVEDLARWDRNFYDGKVGGQPLLDRLTERGVLNGGKQIDYAFGLVHGNHAGAATIDHGGSDAGYRSQFTRIPEKGLTVAVLCNLSSVDPEALALQVADLYLGNPPPPKASTAPEPGPVPTDVTSFAGLYWYREGDDYRKVVTREGRLVAHRPGPPPDVVLELTPLGGSRFQVAGTPLEARFEPAADGKMSLVEKWGEAGAPRTYESVPSFSPKAKELEAYAGDYVSDEIDMIYRMRFENGRLMLVRSKWKKSALEPAVTDRFMGYGGLYRFVRNDSGTVSGLEIDTGRVVRLRFKRR
jgi:CubicO group peptidase (beta-lactamase class C family)